MNVMTYPLPLRGMCQCMGTVITIFLSHGDTAYWKEHGISANSVSRADSAQLILHGQTSLGKFLTE